jgi:hypothetical protein
MGERTVNDIKKLTEVTLLLREQGMSDDAILNSVRNVLQAREINAGVRYIGERFVGRVVWYDVKKHVGRIRTRDGRLFFVGRASANCDERILAIDAAVTFGILPSPVDSAARLPMAVNVRAAAEGV